MSKIFITGAARRLGKSLAIEFAKRNWDIAFTYNNSGNDAAQLVNHLRSQNVNAYSFQTDITDYQSLKQKFTTMVSEFGLPDLIVNNAGVFPELENIKELSVETWHKVMNTNLNAPFYISKLYAEFEPEYGRIVNIGSIGGLQIWNGRIPYHISKNGIIHLTKVLARELAPNIAVNCVNPGTINFEYEPDEKHVPKIPKDRIPMRDYVTPYEVFKAVEFFATAESSITGQSISVDGGYSL